MWWQRKKRVVSKSVHTTPSRPMAPMPRALTQPKVRIDIDDINGIPAVWLNGARLDGINAVSTGLVSVKVEWHTGIGKPAISKVSLEYISPTNTPGAFVLKTINLASLEDE